jgi:hypothetical protein
MSEEKCTVNEQLLDWSDVKKRDVIVATSAA